MKGIIIWFFFLCALATLRRFKARDFFWNAPNLHCNKIYTSNVIDAMIDPNNKILMDWSPKAACILAVGVFFHHMNIFQGLNYSGFPHDYRSSYYKICGKVSEEILRDPSWYKFKVVRNPYDRAVSSFLHLINYDVIFYDGINDGRGFAYHFPNQTKDDITFEMFLDYMIRFKKSKWSHEYRFLGDIHVTPQARNIEITAWKQARPPNGQHALFNRIVKVENLMDDLAAVNADLRDKHIVPFLPDSNFKDEHIVRRSNINSNYAGNMTYGYLSKIGIPKNYRDFYSKHNMKLVQEIFFYDFLLYDYDFAYDLSV